MVRRMGSQPGFRSTPLAATSITEHKSVFIGERAVGRLEDKRIVVTGAGRGLGRTIAHRLVAEGAIVIGVARNAERLATELEPLGSRAIGLVGDLTIPADVDRIFAEIERRFGQLDALVNNAAVYDVFNLEEAEPERIRATIDANLLAPILCIRGAMPLLRKAGGGDVVNITSESVHSPFALLSAYAATKAGLETLSRALRTELRPDRIRVTALRIGALSDPERKLDPAIVGRFVQANAKVLKQAIGGRLIELDTVAGVLVDLLTLPPEAAYELVDLRCRG